MNMNKVAELTTMKTSIEPSAAKKKLKRTNFASSANKELVQGVVVVLLTLVVGVGVVAKAKRSKKAKLARTAIFGS